MSDLEKLKFPALELSGRNYIVWALEAKNYLLADGLGHTILDTFRVPDDNILTQLEERHQREGARAACLLLRHLHRDLKTNYLEERHPAAIWRSLRLRFDTNRQQTRLPILNDEWNKLCFYNFKTVTEFASELYRITSELSWCGRAVPEAEKIEKTLSTFHPAERILAAQHRQTGHTTFDALVAALLLEEKHGQLLQRNHDERRLSADSTASKPKPESNYGDAGRARGRGGGKGKFENGGKKAWKQKRKWQRGQAKGSRKGRNEKHDKPQEQRGGSTHDQGACHRCGLHGHWANKCRTPEFHCKLYQQSKRSTNGTSNGKAPRAAKQVRFMTDFSEDSDSESHVVEVNVSTTCFGMTDCLVDSGTTHVILTDKRFFVTLDNTRATSTIKTLGGSTALAKGGGRARVQLPRGTIIDIEHAIYAPDASRNLLSFVDLRKSGYHLNTARNADDAECLLLADPTGTIIEEFVASGNELYRTAIKNVDSDGVLYSRGKTSSFHDGFLGGQ